MATIEEVIFERMSKYMALTAFVSVRIYPGAIPPEVDQPAIAYQKFQGVTGLTHSGPTGSQRCRIRFTVAAEDYAGKKAVAEQIRACWDGYSGAIGDITVELARIDDMSDIEEARTEAALGEQVDVLFWYR